MNKLETIETIFPVIYGQLMEGFNGRPDRPSKTEGMRNLNLYQAYLSILRVYGLPVINGEMIDLTRYTDQSFRFQCPFIEGPVADRNYRLKLTLRSGELWHPLAFREDSPLDRRDYVELRLGKKTQEWDIYPESTAVFRFYPEGFERDDFSHVDQSVNDQVRRGNKNALVHVSRNLPVLLNRF